MSCREARPAWLSAIASASARPARRRQGWWTKGPRLAQHLMPDPGSAGTRPTARLTNSIRSMSTEAMLVPLPLVEISVKTRAGSAEPMQPARRETRVLEPRTRKST